MNQKLYKSHTRKDSLDYKSIKIKVESFTEVRKSSVND